MYIICIHDVLCICVSVRIKMSVGCVYAHINMDTCMHERNCTNIKHTHIHMYCTGILDVSGPLCGMQCRQ